jgi:nondiscriminating aspartyl-tRNA synthetase
MERTFIGELGNLAGEEVLLRGWVGRLRKLARTSFIIVYDCTGTAQCVAATERLRDLDLSAEDAVELRGRVRLEPRSRAGFEIDVLAIGILNNAAPTLPFTSTSDLSDVAQEIVLEHRPLSLRNQTVGEIFRVQEAIVQLFREFLSTNRFTEIFTSKIVANGTEGGTDLFAISYFDRIAYLAQSPQFYKEQGVAGLERVFETGHVYRSEPHATSRHLTEYYSLDLELGFIDGPEDVIELERRLLTHVFDGLNDRFAEAIARRGMFPLPSMLDVPIWEFEECLERLGAAHGRSDLIDDLDPEAERRLCALAEAETGVPAVFVLGFPLTGRPFYTAPRGSGGGAQSFDLLFRGLEITTGGQRLHRRADLERAIASRGIGTGPFASHLVAFDQGMPPHGGLAIGLERLTLTVLGLRNVREATMYPRDRFHLEP